MVNLLVKFSNQNIINIKDLIEFNQLNTNHFKKIVMKLNI